MKSLNFTEVIFIVAVFGTKYMIQTSVFHLKGKNVNGKLYSSYLSIFLSQVVFTKLFCHYQNKRTTGFKILQLLPFKLTNVCANPAFCWLRHVRRYSALLWRGFSSKSLRVYFRKMTWLNQHPLGCIPFSFSPTWQPHLTLSVVLIWKHHNLIQLKRIENWFGKQ